MHTLNHPQPELTGTGKHPWDEEAMSPYSTPPPLRMTSEHTGRFPEAFLGFEIIKNVCLRLTTPQHKRKVTSLLPGPQVILGENIGRSQFKCRESSSKSHEISGPAFEV